MCTLLLMETHIDVDFLVCRDYAAKPQASLGLKEFQPLQLLSGRPLSPHLSCSLSTTQCPPSLLLPLPSLPEQSTLLGWLTSQTLPQLQLSRACPSQTCSRTGRSLLPLRLNQAVSLCISQSRGALKTCASKLQPWASQRLVARLLWQN